MISKWCRYALILLIGSYLSMHFLLLFGSMRSLFFVQDILKQYLTIMQVLILFWFFSVLITYALFNKTKLKTLLIIAASTISALLTFGFLNRKKVFIYEYIMEIIFSWFNRPYPTQGETDILFLMKVQFIVILPVFFLIYFILINFILKQSGNVHSKRTGDHIDL